MQNIYHLCDHGGTLRYRALARSVNEGGSALNTAIKKLWKIGLIYEYIEIRKNKRTLNLTDEGIAIAKRVLEIELILSSIKIKEGNRKMNENVENRKRSKLN